MAIDEKYGRVTTEFGDIGTDEPVVVFRASDRLLPDVLRIYGTLCRLAGSPEQHLSLISITGATVTAWQHEHGARMPASNGWAARNA